MKAALPPHRKLGAPRLGVRPRRARRAERPPLPFGTQKRGWRWPQRDETAAGTATLGKRHEGVWNRRHLICGPSVHEHPGEHTPLPYKMLRQISFKVVQRRPTVGAGTRLVGSLPGRGPATAAGAFTLTQAHRRHAGATDQTSSTPVRAKRAVPTHSFAVHSTFQIMAPKR